ncbi:MAG: stage II sporulation protein R [Roseburia sp.]
MKKYRGIVIFAGVLLTSLCFWQNVNAKKNTAASLQPEIAEKILRFHIRANSDEELDQELKLKVRDAIGVLLGEDLTNTKNIEESKEIIQEKIPQIMETAKEVIVAEGYSYEVDAYLTTTYFPEKTYGDYTFPEGEYQALEVVIGEGEGHNWWCVLYPNMCFRGSVYEVVDEGAKEELQEVLTTEEYEAVFSERNYEVRFWLADWLENLMESYQ